MEKRREKYKISKERRELIFQKECKVKSYISNANKTLNHKRKKRKSVINEWFFYPPVAKHYASYHIGDWFTISYHIISQHIISYHIKA